MPRSVIVLGIAAPLAAADLIWKHVAATPSWAYHPRGPGWLLLSFVLVGVALAAARLSSLVATVAAGVMAGGVVGNALSAAWNGMRVPDPIILAGERAVIAFNLADIFVSTGTLVLTAALAAALVRNRDMLPSRNRH